MNTACVFKNVAPGALQGMTHVSPPFASSKCSPLDYAVKAPPSTLSAAWGGRQGAGGLCYLGDLHPSRSRAGRKGMIRNTSTCLGWIIPHLAPINSLSLLTFVFLSITVLNKQNKNKKVLLQSLDFSYVKRSSCMSFELEMSAVLGARRGLKLGQLDAILLQAKPACILPGGWGASASGLLNGLVLSPPLPARHLQLPVHCRTAACSLVSSRVGC